MRKKARNYQPALAVPLDISVTLKACAEDSRRFHERAALIQAMIAEMVLLARKRGRPTVKEDEYEKAA